MNQKKRKLIHALLCVIIAALAVYGIYAYLEKKRIERELYEAAMKALDEELGANRSLAQKIDDRYITAAGAVYEQENDPAFREESVNTLNLPVDAIGDSVMLGAAANLKETFPNAYVDAAVNRSYYPLLDIVSKRAAAKTLGDPVVIGIGTNGPLSLSVCHQVLDLCKDRQVFWLTTNNNWQFDNTDTILSFAQDYDNVTIIDWDTFSDGHDEYFYRDGIHLRPEGREAYTKLIRDSITERLWNLMPHEKNRTLLIGDGALLSCKSLMENLNEDEDLLIREENDAEMILSHIRMLEEKHILPERIIIAMQDEALLDELCKKTEAFRKPETLRIVMNEENKDSEADETIRLYEECEEIYAVDQIHLSSEASDILTKRILEMIG